MVHVNLAARPEFLAGDHTRLRELLHPAKQALALGYSMAHGVLAPGARSKRHRLTSSEVYYIIAGRGRLILRGGRRMKKYWNRRRCCQESQRGRMPCESEDCRIGW